MATELDDDLKLLKGSALNRINALKTEIQTRQNIATSKNPNSDPSLKSISSEGQGGEHHTTFWNRLFGWINR